MNLLHVLHLPIYEQLRIEEGLIRTDHQSWCLINESSTPSIVMGISGKPEELIDEDKRASAGIPLIRRFSGGGTVIVDEGTIFVTFIFPKDAHSFPSFPEPILNWTDELYRSAFNLFTLRENDYVIGNRKCGGNAQYIKKDRWLHHTSFLWDYQPHHMDLLLHPKKTPPYRAGRPHADFLCKLSDHFPSKAAFTLQLKQELSRRYTLHEVPLDSLSFPPHRQATVWC